MTVKTVTNEIKVSWICALICKFSTNTCLHFTTWRSYTVLIMYLKSWYIMLCNIVSYWFSVGDPLCAVTCSNTECDIIIWMSREEHCAFCWLSVVMSCCLPPVPSGLSLVRRWYWNTCLLQMVVFQSVLVLRISVCQATQENYTSFISLHTFLDTDKALARIGCTWDKFVQDHWGCELFLVPSFCEVLLREFPLWPVAVLTSL